VNKLVLLSIVWLFLAGCSPPQAATPPPTPQALDAALTPALRPISAALHNCALVHPEIGLFLEETPASSLNLQDGKLGFQIGEPPSGPEVAAPIAEEEIVVILNPGNPSSQLSKQNLKDLFGGKITDWQELGTSSLSTQIWIYPNGDEVRSLFDEVVLQGESNSTWAMLAPDPEAMLEAVSMEPGAVGYLPRAWLGLPGNANKVKQAQLDEDLVISLRQPVLALSTSQPGPAARSLLTCLQGEQGQQDLKGFYEPWKP
jgi:hypothetical protein